MSQENVEFVAGIFEATESMDKQVMLAALPEMVPQLCDPEIEWLDTFGDYGFEIERITDCRGENVFVALSEHGTGALSEAPSEQRLYAVVTLKDGKVRRSVRSSDFRLPLRVHPPGASQPTSRAVPRRLHAELRRDWERQ